MNIEKHIQITDPTISIVEILKNATDLSSTQIKQAVSSGCLWLQNGVNTKRLRRLKKTLIVGQQLHFYYNQEILQQSPLVAELIEDNHAYSIWYKPAGMLCQGSKWSDHTTIYRYAERHLKPQRNAIIVHRLDKMTSGLIILAHQRKTAAAFSHLFEQRKINKCYRALVHGIFDSTDELTIDSPLNKKPAISQIQAIKNEPASNLSLIDICIETGRKHQIRQHLSGLGYPVVGDRLYGKKHLENEPDLQLTAYRLSFNCPLTNEIKSYQLDEDKLPHFG